jgi:hypothetical protein
VRSPSPLPTRIGPVEFAEFGRMVAVRCPQDFAHVLQSAGGVWEPGSRRWLVERRRIGPVIRALQRATDPLFRCAGLTLSGARWAARSLRRHQPPPCWRPCWPRGDWSGCRAMHLASSSAPPPPGLRHAGEAARTLTCRQVTEEGHRPFLINSARRYSSAIWKISRGWVSRSAQGSGSHL